MKVRAFRHGPYKMKTFILIIFVGCIYSQFALSAGFDEFDGNIISEFADRLGPISKMSFRAVSKKCRSFTDVTPTDILAAHARCDVSLSDTLTKLVTVSRVKDLDVLSSPYMMTYADYDEKSKILSKYINDVLELIRQRKRDKHPVAISHSPSPNVDFEVNVYLNFAKHEPEEIETCMKNVYEKLLDGNDVIYMRQYSLMYSSVCGFVNIQDTVGSRQLLRNQCMQKSGLMWDLR